MAREVFASLRLLAVFVPLSGAFISQDWKIHGVWSNTRSLKKTTHASCTLPTTVPIDYFAVYINSTYPLLSNEAWSLQLLSKSSDGTGLVYQNLGRMYPPRIVLHFHFSTFGVMELTGTCSFMPLNERLRTTTAQPTTELFPHFNGLIIPDRFLSPNFGSDTSPMSTTWYPGFGVGPCLTTRMTFSDFRFQFTGDEPLPYDSTTPTEGTTTTTSLPPTNRLPQRRPLPRFKRLSILPSPEVDDPSKEGNLQPIQPLMPTERQIINYIDAIELSMMFFAAQRSGNFERAPMTKPYEWMRTSGTFHSAPDGRDLTGGWYNGNDNVKLTFPMAAATTVLAWGYDTWNHIYSTSGLDNTFKETIKWPLDYFLKSWDQDEQTLYVQIGDLSKERTMWNRADDFVYNTLWNKNQWPVYSVSPSNPGSDVAAEVATAMALSSLIQFDDVTYSSRLIDTAEEIYQFAKSYPGKYSDHVPAGGEGYPDYTSTGYNDELCFAAAVLHNVTGSNKYLTDAESFFSTFEHTGTPDFFSWDDKRVACAVMLYKITQGERYATYVENFREKWMSASGKQTPNGFAWRTEEGTLRHTANAIFILLESIEANIFEPNIEEDIYIWAAGQTDYILGVNGMKRSYLIGYGDIYVKNPYHKNSACMHPAKPCGWNFYNSEEKNENELAGALVGGPDLNDFHADDRQNTKGNSVALDYNAGFQSALLGLQSEKEALKKACDDRLNDMNTDAWTNVPFTYSSSFATLEIDPGMSETTTAQGSTSTTPYTTPQPTPVPDKPEVFNYADALGKSILFYAAQRSGQAPENNPIPWRHWDNADTANGGGWFDDGSALKTTKVMASAVSIIGWGALKFKAGYEAAGALDDLYDSLKWPLDYFIKIWQPDQQILLQKVGLEAYERAYWSRPIGVGLQKSHASLISVDRMKRGGKGAEVAADVATALAIGSVLFKDKDTQYSERLLTAAKQVYTFANKLDKTFKDDSSVYYSDPGEDFGDEMCVAAWWMFKASQENAYYNDGMTYMSRNETNFVLDWKNKDALCHILVYEHTGSFRSSFLILEGLRSLTEQTKYTPQGLAWHDDESLKFAANGAFIQVLAESYGIRSSSPDFYKTQIDYMLGKNNQAFSYQIGYGNRYPRRPHHRSSSCPDYMETCDWSIYNAPGKNPHDLIGALVSGPDINDVYEDVRSNYTTNRVSVEHNAGFQSVLAYLVERYPLTSTASSISTSTTTRTAATQKDIINTTRRTTKATTRRPTKATTRQTTKGEIPTKVPTQRPAAKTDTLHRLISTIGIVQPTTAGTRGNGRSRPDGLTPTNQNTAITDNAISASTCINATSNIVLCFAFVHFLCFAPFW